MFIEQNWSFGFLLKGYSIYKNKSPEIHRALSEFFNELMYYQKL